MDIAVPAICMCNLSVPIAPLHFVNIH